MRRYLPALLILHPQGRLTYAPANRVCWEELWPSLLSVSASEGQDPTLSAFVWVTDGVMALGAAPLAQEAVGHLCQPLLQLPQLLKSASLPCTWLILPPRPHITILYSFLAES